MSSSAHHLTIAFHDRTHTCTHDTLKLDLASGKIH